MRMRTWIPVVLIVGVAGAVDTLSGEDQATTRVIDLRPVADAEIPLENPHKGWYHHFPDNHPDKYKLAADADLLDFPGMDHLYIRLAWSYLEPREGEFHWEVILHRELLDKDGYYQIAEISIE